jgi:DNA-binding transcriptional LysR family regulator
MLDIGFLRVPILSPGPLRTILVHKEPFKLFLPAAHPLASRGNLALEHLDGVAFVTYAGRNAPGFAAVLSKIMQDAGIQPSQTHEASDMYTLISLVSAGVGVAIAPASLVNYRLPDVVVRDIQGVRPSEIALAYRAGIEHPVALAFMRMAVSMYSGERIEF